MIKSVAPYIGKYKNNALILLEFTYNPDKNLFKYLIILIYKNIFKKIYI